MRYESNRVKIQAVLPEAVVPDVVERLMLVGIDDIVVSVVRSSAGPKETRSFRGVLYSEDLIERCALECWPDDEQAEAAGRAIQQALAKSASDALLYVSVTEDT
jgi:nitrogen regulatory protein PII